LLASEDKTETGSIFTFVFVAARLGHPRFHQ
jgi:hypothetical protein